MAKMVDLGLLDYDQPIANYWPEFAQNGKENILVRDLMRHESGLARLSKTVKHEDLFTENIKNNSIGKLIEEDYQEFPPNQPCQYHAITKDWIANEIFRRVEPNGRTMGEYLQQEVIPILGDDGIHIGLPKEKFSNL